VTLDRRRELQQILASTMLQTDMRQGDAQARRTLDEAREELQSLDHRHEANEAAA
jgi:hypothetical protein